MGVAEIRMLRWISKNKQKDKIQNENFLLKDRSDPNWWKDEREMLEMVWSCLEESDYCTNEKEWVNSSGRNKKSRGRPKITFVEIIKKDMLIKEVTCGRSWLIWGFITDPKKFGTKAWLLLWLERNVLRQNL